MEGQQQRACNWFPIKRETLSNPIFKDSVSLSVFVGLSCKAAFVETDYLGIRLNPGQLLISIRHEAEKMGIDRCKFTRVLQAMKTAQIIDFEKVKTTFLKCATNLSQQMSQQMSHKNTLITICDLVSYYESVATNLSQQMSQQMSHQFEPLNNNIYNKTNNNNIGGISMGDNVGETPTAQTSENLNKKGFVKWWNETKVKTQSQMPGITTKAPLSEKRAKAIRAMICKYDKATVMAVCLYCFKSDFYNGRQNGNGHGNWVADIDFLFKPSNFEKALERMENEKGNQGGEAATPNQPTTPKPTNPQTPGEFGGLGIYGRIFEN